MNDEQRDYIIIGVIDGKPVHLGYISGTDTFSRSKSMAEIYFKSWNDPNKDYLTSVRVFTLCSPFEIAFELNR